MLTLSFTGSIPKENLWLNTTIPRVSTFGRPDPTDGYPRSDGTSASTRNYNPFDQLISWDSAPSFLNNTSLTQLWSSPQPNVLISTRIVYAVEGGNQFHICGNNPNINFNIYQGPSQLDSTNFIAQQPVGFDTAGQINYCFNSVCPPPFEFNTTPSTVGSTQPYNLQAIPWNSGNCANQNVENLTLTAQLFVTLTVTCQTATELETGFCPQFCNIRGNEEQCFDAYRHILFN